MKRSTKLAGLVLAVAPHTPAFPLQDTQAICGWNGPGPFLIENNYLEAAGENVMFGGSDPSIPHLVPNDITIRRRNLIWWPVAWMTQS
jgi:hypothetical protein